jgi:hypothetical protein
VGAGVVLFLLFFQSGVTGLVFGARDAGLRRLARRHGIAVPSLESRRSGEAVGVVDIAPHTGRGGTPAFVAPEYELADQWPFAATPPATPTVTS